MSKFDEVWPCVSQKEFESHYIGIAKEDIKKGDFVVINRRSGELFMTEAKALRGKSVLADLKAYEEAEKGLARTQICAEIMAEKYPKRSCFGWIVQEMVKLLKKWSKNEGS